MDQIVTPVCETMKTLKPLISEHGYMAGSVALGIPASYYLYERYMTDQMTQKIRARAKRSKDDIEALRKELENNTDNIDPNIVQLSFQELQRKLQSGELSATKVLRSYQAKALDVNDKTNAITDVIKDASMHARHLDAMDSSQRGPLHGVPVSLKESCGVKGLDCTAGFGELIDVPMENDSVLVQVLRSLGAVPFVRTNIPQAMRSIGCSNPIYGVTSNPHDPTRSPGGSSGGEGAIIGGRGSILGVGSDIGGSVRIPASFCGIAALKPTAGRISLSGNFHQRKMGAQRIVPPTDGPMAQDVSTLVHFMQSVLCPTHFEIDPCVPPIPFRQKIYQSERPLKIGFYINDGCTKVVPAVERAMLMSKAVLQRLGHNVVDVEPFQSLHLFSDIFLPTILGDNGKGYEHLIKYDNSNKDLIGLLKFQKKPYYIRWILAKIKEMTSYDPVVVEMMKREELKTVTDWFRMSKDVFVYKEDYTKRWQALGLDALICPCTPCVAPDTDTSLLGVVTYTCVFNVINYPAGTVPVTTVTKDDVAKTMDPAYYKAETGLEKMIQADSKGTEGMPVGIQVVARPFMEENVLRVMAELENGFKN